MAAASSLTATAASGEVLQTVGGESPWMLASVSEPSASAGSPAEPLEEAAPLLGDPTAGPDGVIVDSQTEPEPTAWPRTKAAWNRIEQWMPQGMIPYFGPRTPDSREGPWHRPAAGGPWLA